MPARRLSMRKIKEVLRLKFDGKQSNRNIAVSCSVSRSTVADYLLRAKAAGLTWPLPNGLSETALDQLLFPPREISSRSSPEPDWNEIFKELKRKSVTMSLLWQEYREKHPDGYQYSWFCQKYKDWSGKLDLVMRQDHRAGEKLFVDYAGQTVNIVNPDTGEIRSTQIFVATLGANNYSFSEATFSQSLPDWIGSHVRAFDFFGGVPEILVPDNLKSGVKKACYYDPEINPTYLDMALHYDTAIIPARVRKPKDKAKVEQGVQMVERWILARLRNHTFFSLNDLNREIAGLLEILNNRPFKKLPGCRKSLFDSLDKPALKALPKTPYQFAQWKKATVNIDYHIEVNGHYYSVPYKLVKRKLDVRFTDMTIECFHKGARVASHLRSYQKGRHTTIKEHMPLRHQRYLEWSPERFLRWAAKIGPQAKELAEKILDLRSYPQQAYRTLLGILRLEKSYGRQRLEAACHRALMIGAVSYRSVESILKNGLDHQPLPTPPAPPTLVDHTNIRGSEYYCHEGGQNVDASYH